MHIGRVVRVLRLANGLKLGDLASRVEVSAGFLSQVEGGDKEPSLTVVRALAKSLNVPMDLLLEVTQPGEGTLRTSDKKTSDLAKVLKRMEDAEEQLRSLLGTTANEF